MILLIINYFYKQPVPLITSYLSHIFKDEKIYEKTFYDHKRVIKSDELKFRDLLYE